MNGYPLHYEDMKDEDFTPENEVEIVTSPSEIPQFANEDEAARWWDTHSLADNLWSKSRRGPPPHWAERAAAERERRASVTQGIDNTALLRKAMLVTGDFDSVPKAKDPEERAILAKTPPDVSNSTSVSLIAVGIGVCGLLAVGFMLYELFRSKSIPGAFEPTGIPHLRVLRAGSAAFEAIETASRIKTYR